MPSARTENPKRIIHVATGIVATSVLMSASTLWGRLFNSYARRSMKASEGFARFQARQSARSPKSLRDAEPILQWVRCVARSHFAVLAPILLVTLLSLLAGWRSLVPDGVAIWLPLTGFLLGCVIMGVLSRLRAAHVILIAVAIYIGAIVLVTLIDFSWRGVMLGPIELGAVADSWIGLAQTVFELIPFLKVFQGLALMASGWSAETIVQRLVFNLVAFSLFGLIGFALAGITAVVRHRPSLYVATPPEVTGVEAPPEILGMVAPTKVDVSAQPPSAGTPPTPPPNVTPRPSPHTPPPQPVAVELPASPAPSAQAIAALKGKGAQHLKSTGQQVPAGQSRCPFCHATMIPGSTYCNACQKQTA